MNINLNNIGIRPEMMGAGTVGAERETANASQASRAKPNLEITAGVADLESSEPVADVPASALERNDALGNLVNSAFNLPPPPMPAFDMVRA